MSDEQEDKIAALERKVAELERANAPPSPPISDAEWRDQMHALAERRASHQYHFSREELAQFRSAVPDSEMRQIAMRDARAPQGPSSAGVIPSSQQQSNVRGNVPGMGTGWQSERQLGPQPGIDLIDAIAIADDVRGRKK
jgi:hypothetical protein